MLSADWTTDCTAADGVGVMRLSCLEMETCKLEMTSKTERRRQHWLVSIAMFDWAAEGSVSEPYTVSEKLVKNYQEGMQMRGE